MRTALIAGLADGPDIDIPRVLATLALWNEAEGGPADGAGWLLVARLWRQAGAPDSALAALRRASEGGGTPPGLLSLEAARMAFLADSPDPGAEAYWAGCDWAEKDVLQEYWRDFALIATPEEADAWLAAIDGPESRRAEAACGVLRQGWGRRASLEGSSVSERLAVHYDRLRYARANYALVASRMRLGPNTRLLSEQAGRPAVDFDDRGLIYVRLGEPDRTATFAGSPGPLRQLPRSNPNSPVEFGWSNVIKEFQVSSECYHPNESWAYDFPEGPRLYHFSPLEGSANWWLLENLADLYRCGDPTAAVAVENGIPMSIATLTPITGSGHVPVSRVAWLVLGDLYMSRAGLDPAFGALAQRVFSSGPETLGGTDAQGLQSLSPGALRLQGELAKERQANFDEAEETLTSIVDRPYVRADVSLLFELLQFRQEAGAGGTRVWLNAIVEGRDLRGLPAGDGGDRDGATEFRYSVRADFNLVDEQGDLFRKTTVFSLSAGEELGKDVGVPVRVALDVPPGKYGYSVVVRDANDERERPSGNWRSDSLTVHSYRASVPLLSDVAFAPDSGGAWSFNPGMALPITPVHRTNDAGFAWLYFEAYGLSPTGQYSVDVRLEPRDGDGEPFTLTFAGAPPGTDESAVRRLLRLELADTPPGQYTVRLTVTDGLGRTSLPLETDLEVRPQSS